VTEIAAGNGDDERDRGYRQLAIRGDVIEHLREQAADIDGVCGSEKRALIESFVGERLLDQALAIVKGAGNLERRDVLSQGSELLFLSLANALRGIENDDADSGDAKKSVGHSAPGIARSGHEDGEEARFPADKIAHQASQETSAKILEGKRGP